MHRYKAQLRFNDIDILGHLNNTVYFSLYDLGKARFMEEARLRRGAEPPACVIADIHCSYLHPVRYGDEIYVTTRCESIGDKSFTLYQEMIDGAGEVRSRCTTVMVYIDPSTGRPAALPENFRTALNTTL